MKQETFEKARAIAGLHDEYVEHLEGLRIFLERAGERHYFVARNSKSGDSIDLKNELLPMKNFLIQYRAILGAEIDKLNEQFEVL